MTALLTPPPVRKHTPDDLFLLPDHGKGFELVEGEMKELNVSFQSSFTAGRVCTRLTNHVEARGLGWVSPEGTSYRCFPDEPTLVRRADTSFHAIGRITLEQARRQGHCTVVPDLVVEVVSPNDLAYEVNEKRIEWLEAGAKLVWVIDPVQETIHAYRADGTVHLFGRSDALTAEPVLPQFTVSVAELFQLPVETPA